MPNENIKRAQSTLSEAISTIELAKRELNMAEDGNDLPDEESQSDADIFLYIMEHGQAIHIAHVNPKSHPGPIEIRDKEHRGHGTSIFAAFTDYHNNGGKFEYDSRLATSEMSQHPDKHLYTYFMTEVDYPTSMRVSRSKNHQYHCDVWRRKVGEVFLPGKQIGARTWGLAIQSLKDFFDRGMTSP